MITIEKYEECPQCGEYSDRWRYEGQICTACGYPDDPTGLVVSEIAEERDRQCRDEGFDNEHDDRHDGGELAKAAAAYAYASTTQKWELIISNIMWPWAVEWWKPTTRRRNLIKAGALIVAEIERLDRAAEAERS